MKEKEMNNSFVNKSQNLSVGEKIISAADNFVGRRKFKNPLQYVQTFLQGIDDAISKSVVKPTSFVVLFTESNVAKCSFISSGMTMTEVFQSLTIPQDLFSIFVWHRVSSREDSVISGKRTAVWVDKNGLQFFFGEIDGKLKLIPEQKHRLGF
jgi:hypothetical protein